MDLDDFLTQPRLLKVVHAMAQRDPHPLTFRQFMDASGYFPEAAADLRDRMEAWNLITVASKGQRGTRQQIRLTPHGMELDHLIGQMALVVEKAVRSKGPGNSG